MFRSTSALLIAIVFALPAAAHHSPPSLTEIEWNPESQRFEVAMRLAIPDLQDAISGNLNRRFRVEGAEDRDEQIRNYVSEHFSVIFEGDKECRLRWVGVELELHDVWVYFEAESVTDPTVERTQKQTPVDRWEGFLRPANKSTPARNVIVQNSCMLKLRPGQENIVQLRMDGNTTTKTLTAKSDRTTIR